MNFPRLLGSPLSSPVIVTVQKLVNDVVFVCLRSLVKKFSFQLLVVVILLWIFHVNKRMFGARDAFHLVVIAFLSGNGYLLH